MLQTRDVLDTLQQQHSDAPALVLMDLDEEILCWSFRDLQQHTRYCAGILREAGAQPGDCVLLCCRDLPHFFAIFHACLSLRLCLLPLHQDQDEQLVQSVIENYAPRFAIVDELWSRQGWLQQRALASTKFILRSALGQWLRPQLVQAGLPEAVLGKPAIPTADTAVVFHSSGSSGSPKAIHYSRQQLDTFLFWQQQLFAPFKDIATEEGTTNPTPRISVLPLLHWGGLSFCLQALLEGRCVYLVNEFYPDALFEVIENSGCQMLMLLPAMYRELLEMLEEGLCPDSLRYCLTMGEALPAGLSQRLHAQHGLHLCTAYGMSEALSGLAHGSVPWDQIPEGSCGRRQFGELKLVDSSGRESSDNGSADNGSAEGELWVRNATTTPCYREPALLQQKYVDGWYRTGDWFYRDAAGHYYFRSRCDDMCVHNGRNVYPQQVEAVFIEHAAVDACVAAPITTHDGAQRLAILVVPDPFTSPSANELLDYYLQHGALYAAPVFVLVSETVPSTISGKPERVAVAQWLQQAYDQAQPSRIRS